MPFGPTASGPVNSGYDTILCPGIYAVDSASARGVMKSDIDILVIARLNGWVVRMQLIPSLCGTGEIFEEKSRAGFN